MIVPTWVSGWSVFRSRDMRAGEKIIHNWFISTLNSGLILLSICYYLPYRVLWMLHAFFPQVLMLSSLCGTIPLHSVCEMWMECLWWLVRERACDSNCAPFPWKDKWLSSQLSKQKWLSLENLSMRTGQKSWVSAWSQRVCVQVYICWQD